MMVFIRLKQFFAIQAINVAFLSQLSLLKGIDLLHLSVAPEERPRVLKPEGDPSGQALFPDVQHPIVVADAGFAAALAADGNVLDSFQISR